jgi:two-component sensor histidine kinase/putative methionine-R-sulfoxide reductase with GAF domain
MAEPNASPFAATMALMAVIDQHADGVDALRPAYLVGESAANADLTIEETFELLESEAGDALHELNADVLGSIVRGYVDQIVRTRGVTRRRSAGRLSSHVSRLAALHHINRAATGSLQLDNMLATVVRVVADTVQCDACSVFLHDSASDTLMLRATVGLNQDIVRRLTIRSDAGITGLAASQRQTQFALDARAHPAFFTYPTVGEEQFVSQVSIPLLLREPERLVGVMNIQTLTTRDFDPDEITFLETAAGELAIAIENARLYSQTDAALTERINELRALQAVTRSIASTLQQDTLFPMIATQAAQLVGGTEAVIFRVGADQTPHEMTVLARVNRPDGDDGDATLREFIAELCRTRTARVLPPGSASDDNTLVFGAPLMTGHAVLGAICAWAPAAQNHANAKLGLFQAFADSAALALENADLYDEARRGYATASTLLQEMHHRVRNNLATVAALLSMQARHASYADWTAPLQEAVARVQSIAAVHNLLSSGNLTSAAITAIAKQVADEASINVVPPTLKLTFDVETSDIEVSSRQATILALLINECLTNAIEHGFASRAYGVITVRVSEDDGWIQVRIDDDGVGLPDGFSIEGGRQLGLRIANTLATSDLGGSFAMVQRQPCGAAAVIRFPKSRAR